MSTAKDPLAEIAKIARELTGVQLHERHWDMIKSRLQKRLAELNLKTHDEYLHYFLTNKEKESPKLISLLTTHHTFFFREFSHFEFLSATALPELLPLVRARPDRTLRVWSAASSRGQEAYSLAMFLDLHLKRLDPTIKFEILGTDVDAESVAIAKNGVYLRDELKEAPLSLVGDHWSRGKGDIAAYVKAKNSLRSHCKFSAFNLLDLKMTRPAPEKFDIIFCRNVFIYFSHEQVRSLVKDLFAQMVPQGYLFVGVSESLSQLDLPIASLGPSIYRQKSAVEKKPAEKPSEKPLTAVAPPATVSSPSPIRVLCVDDSPIILTLMKQILTKQEGFEIVGTAANGKEAAAQVARLNPDALTLDIHMPEMTGIEYLKAHFRPGHPAVVVVSSVSRDDAQLAGQALDFGAADFVEKPALANLTERGEEIRAKVRCAVFAAAMAIKTQRSLDRSFQTHREIQDADQKLRVVVMNLSQRSKLKSFFSELKGSQPPCVILVDGAKDALTKIAEVLGTQAGRKVTYVESIPARLKADECYLADFGSQAVPLAEKFAQQRPTSILVFGEVAKGSAEKLLQYRGAHLVLEDLGQGRGTATLNEAANDVVPATSFGYLSVEFLANKVADSSKKAA